MGILDLLGLGNKANEIKEYKAKGAVILDVRTVEEYNDGHIKGAINIPLQVLNERINEIKHWEKPIIACCKSGVRSGKATQILNQNHIDCINGGGWNSLQDKL